ncbi:MAG: copper resistance protein B [Pseudomonadota bacterium]
MATAREALYASHGNQLVGLVLGERLETQLRDGDDNTVWEAQGWYGGDLRKWWWKSEGDYAHGEGAFEEVELQSLYSRAVAPFWDVQMGLRMDLEPTPLRTYATLGVQGVAPYWFELDAALFLSDRGDLSARLEAEYELRLTQRLLLQPRVELNVALTEDASRRVDDGPNDVEAGVRLRYEVRREFAPYIGAVWARAGGGQDDADPAGWRLVGGFRFWF